ncbi:hypothetical protein JG688_00002528 [Phytophthora aleatoria]|uniref:Carboxylesterase type B domain-containing protein n=1 Tax=Phytophthora aleatoria TaxID=2496075 RepID=A0A8J5IV74_9STRA|nr:hypothetical protein JG688_00002528 [Phytophthora aleatoria]
MRVYALLRTAVVVPVLSASLPTVELDYTTVQAVGGNTTVGYYMYQNSRFSAVPTGDLRFAAPELPPQENDTNTGANLADADVAWSKHPEGLFDLSQDFIFVACNYRLGITGLAHGPFWVKTYIDKFGGNPNDVTAVGFSAGGSQAMFQMTRFGGNAPQLFEKAYIMSPGYVPGAGHHHAVQFWQNVPSVGCDGGHLGCMREVDFSTLQDAASEVVSEYTYQYQPRVDGLIIPGTSAGLRFADMKQSLDLTAKNLALTNALKNATRSAGSGLLKALREDLSLAWTYLLSFVITGNSNTMWPDDKLYWPQYNESSVGTEIVFDDTFTVADDDLANSKSLFWNKALWY